MTIPRIGITLGDPAGIGPELVLKVLSSGEALPEASYTIFGNSHLIDEVKKSLGIQIQPLIPSEEKRSIVPGTFLHEVVSPEPRPEKRAPSRENGEISFRFFEEAVKAAEEGKIQALVTAPISKKSWSLAGLPWRGHTEFLSQRYPEAIMAFWSEKIKVVLFTSHLPLKLALKKIRREKFLDFLLRLQKDMEKIETRRFQFLAAGLNPHAGEDGLLGTEENKEIIPAIQQAVKQGMDISGPYPPDVVFRMALGSPEKIVIALYHDQGCIPFKLEAFDSGVNLTLGLPFIRTSPDHGTAFDIAGKGRANPLSMMEAIKLAHTLIRLPT
ncbi:MAG: 4-hydroxythreonine-4-phosphate dehydrogenase PdxA [Candidatus Aminicenantales bacterium]